MVNRWKSLAIALVAVLALTVTIAACAAPTKVLIEDNFTLVPFDAKVWQEKYAPWPLESTYPFNDCGVYINRFFLKDAERVDIVLHSACPQWLGIKGYHNRLVLDVGFEKEPGKSVSLGDYLAKHFWHQERAGGMWKSKIEFIADHDDFYELHITNYTGQSCRCQLMIRLR